MNETDEGAQVTLRAFFSYSSLLAEIARGDTMVCMDRHQTRRVVVTAAALALVPVLGACSKSAESDLDVLAEWRNNAPTTTVTANSTRSALPQLPEGADPFVQENFRVAAIVSYSTARDHVGELLYVAGEFDVGSATWATKMQDLMQKFNEEAMYFGKLNPPTEYAEKHKILMTSMERISSMMEELSTAITDKNFEAGADAISDLQKEANVMVENGKFDEVATYSPTTVPAP
jgi:hypothetical protein